MKRLKNKHRQPCTETDRQRENTDARKHKLLARVCIHTFIHTDTMNGTATLVGNAFIVQLCQH